MNFKLNKTVLVWLVIIFSVLVLGYQASLYFRVIKVPVLTADVPAGKQITNSMIELIEVNPQSPFLKTSITSVNDLFRDGNPQTDNGKYTLVPLFKGQVIDKRALVDSLTDPTFGVGAQIENSDHVAISVLVPLQNAVGINLMPGQRVNMTYASGEVSSIPGAPIKLNTNDIQEITNVQILDVRNENGVKILSNNTPVGKSVMLILSVPADKASEISIAASGQGMVYFSLPSLNGEASQQPSSLPSSMPSGASEAPRNNVNVEREETPTP